MSIPLMVRPGSIIAVGALDDSPEYDYAEDVTFKVYALSDGETAETVIYGASALNGSEEYIESRLIVSNNNGGYIIEYTGEKDCTVELVNVPGKTEVRFNGSATVTI